MEKSKVTAKVRVSERLCFEDTKRIMSPEKFRDFRETGTRRSKFKRGFSKRTSAIDVIARRNLIGNLYNKGREGHLNGEQKKNNTYAKENPSHKAKEKALLEKKNPSLFF